LNCENRSSSCVLVNTCWARTSGIVDSCMYLRRCFPRLPRTPGLPSLSASFPQKGLGLSVRDSWQRPRRDKRGLDPTDDIGATPAMDRRPQPASRPGRCRIRSPPEFADGPRVQSVSNRNSRHACVRFKKCVRWGCLHLPKRALCCGSLIAFTSRRQRHCAFALPSTYRAAAPGSRPHGAPRSLKPSQVFVLEKFAKAARTSARFPSLLECACCML
jgi:hypothetical protein